MKRISVDFWLDPLCPWSWLTAEWLVEAQAQRPLDVTWRVMSLSILNEHADLPPEWAQFLPLGWGPVRALEAASRVDPDSFVPLMQGIARRWHRDGRRDLPEVVDEAVVECGLPSEVAAAAWSPDLDARVRASHEQAMTLGGDDVGSPILGFTRDDGRQVGFYGPVLSVVPRGDEAGRVFDAVRELAITQGFFELKRTRDAEPNLLP